MKERKIIRDLILDPLPIEKQGLLKGTTYKTPATLDFRDLVLKTEDQGNTPQCAAYTGTSWIESVMWRKTGNPVNYDPQALYDAAKLIDGYPDEDGTTLPAIMDSIISLGWIDKTHNDIKYVTTAEELKRAIHKYGTVLCAFDVGLQWSVQKGINMDKRIDATAGGHAVICCGYNRHGVYIQNSWGTDWGSYGFCNIAWDVFKKEFRNGAYFANALDNLEE